MPPVTCQSAAWNTFHVALSAVAPPTPSIVEPVHTLINALPCGDNELTTVEYSVTVLAELPVSPDKLFHKLS